MQDKVAAVALRDPEIVMRPARLGSFHQCRLSFMRILLRRLERDGWRFSRPVFDVDGRGVGTAAYCAHGPGQAYTLVCFGHDLPAGIRSARESAGAWDTTFALFDGVPEAADIQRLSAKLPKQEAGQVSPRELVLCRANRSVRLFEHAVECLAAGRQPDAGMVAEVGYLMRTTAVHGPGRFGAADRETIATRPEFGPPFQPEMLAVYLVRAFALDLVEHMATKLAPTAVPFEPRLRRSLGIGNSTGLGLAPLIVNHPALFNNCIAARETALARVRSLPGASRKDAAGFRRLVARAQINAGQWQSDHPVQVAKLADLRGDMARLAQYLDGGAMGGEAPWDTLYRWGEATLSLEGQEQLVSLLIEPHGGLVDDLAHTMSPDETAAFRIDGAMPLSALRAILEQVYRFALAVERESPASVTRAWYLSTEKLGPRRGERFDDPLAPARDAPRMHRAILGWRGDDSAAAFLLRHPEHRDTAHRAQIAASLPYARIRDNSVSADLLPVDLLRCALAFVGATRFDPRPDRRLRIKMFSGAPSPGELADGNADDWWFPEAGRPEAGG